MLRCLLVTGLALCAGVPQDPQPRPAQDPAPAAAAAAGAANPDTADPGAVVDALYAVISGPAGKARDWERMRKLFHAEGRMLPVVKGRDGALRTLVLKVDDYVQRSGPVLEKNGFFEVELARRTEVFGDIAHVWSTYEGRRAKDDAAPFLRGINSIQLVREQGRWTVLSLQWEQEADAGPIPAKYLPPAEPK